jgi:hypothetical protein
MEFGHLASHRSAVKRAEDPAVKSPPSEGAQALLAPCAAAVCRRREKAQLPPLSLRYQAESPSAHEELTLRTELVTFTTTKRVKGEPSGERHSNYRRTDE